MNSDTPPAILANNKRQQALALLREAASINGLTAYAVHHRHEHGGSTYVLWAQQQPTEDDATSVLSVPFEPERGEDLAIDSLSLEELAGIAARGRAERTQAQMEPGAWLSTLGHPVDPHEVAEWVGMHYRIHLDSQPERRQEWIDRFVEAHPDQFPTYLVSNYWSHNFAGQEAITRWVYRLGPEEDGLIHGQRQEAGGQWIQLNREASQDLEASIRDNDIPSTTDLPLHWGDQVRCTTELPDWASEPPVRSVSQALLDIDRNSEINSSLMAPLEVLLGSWPEGFAAVSAWQELVDALSADKSSPACKNLGAVLQRCNSVSDLIYLDEPWRMTLDHEVEDLAINTVVGTECIRLYLRVERLIASLCDVNSTPKGELRRAAARQMTVWLNG